MTADPTADLRQQLDDLRARAANLPTAEQAVRWAEEDRALVPRVRKVMPGVPAHHVLAVLRALRAIRWASPQPAPAEPPSYVPVPGCPHCPDGHTPPDHGQPWGAYLTPARDGDGQPTTIHVARAGGAHVAESDAQWVRDRLNQPTAEPRDPSCGLPGCLHRPTPEETK